MKSKIGVVGLWHLGCTLSACWSGMGHAVIGYDENDEIVSNLKKYHPPIYEPNLEESLKKGIDGKLLSFTGNIDDLKDCEFVFLTYDTPVLDNDESDLTPLEKAITNLGRILKNDAIVVVSSQTPVGTCNKFRKELQKNNASLDLVYSPENLRLGEAINSYMMPGRIILGVESEATERRVKSLFSGINAEVLSMNLASAEMVKHGINSFLSLSITFANQLSDLCEVSGADILSVIRGMKSEPRIGPKAYLSPGIGFSGGTLGRDLKVLESLNNKSQSKAVLFGTIHKLNSQRKIIILEKVKKLSGNSLKGKQVGILGLTYKPGTSTLRRSLPMEIVQMMIKEGAQVSVFDPKADFKEWTGVKKFQIARSFAELVKNSKIVVLLTEWPEFRSADWESLCEKENPQIIFDSKNFLIDLHLEKMGYRYCGIGKNISDNVIAKTRILK